MSFNLPIELVGQFIDHHLAWRIVQQVARETNYNEQMIILTIIAIQIPRNYFDQFDYFNYN